MASVNTATIDGLYKKYYENYVSEQTLNRQPLKDYFKFEQVEFAGQDVTYNAHVTRNASPMFVAEDGAFADATSQGSIQISVGQRKLMARVRMTWEAMHDSMKTEAAFKSARKDEMTRIIDDIARIEEFALSSDGRGVLCRVDDSTPNGAVTVTVDAPAGVTGDDFGNRFVMPGIFVAFVNPATGEMRTGIRKIVSCSADGTSIVLDAVCDASVADDDYVVQAANSSVTSVLDTSYEHAFMGVMGLFDDGTYRNNYFGADRSRYTQYQSYVKASTGAQSADLFQSVSDVMDQRLGGITSILMGHHSVRRVYLQLTQADRRYSAANLQKPDVGTVAFTQGDMSVGEVPFKAIRTFPLATLLGLDAKGVQLVCYGSEKGKWVDEDGRVFVRAGVGSAARDAFEAWYRMRKQYHSRTPGKAWRCDGLTGQSLVVVREAGIQ